MSKESWSRGFEIATNPSYLKGAWKQFRATSGEIELQKYDGKKPTLGFVPGWTADLSTYHRLVAELEIHFNILPLDLFPSGLKAVSSRLGIRDQAELLLQTLQNAGVLDSVSIVAHSNGGLVALLAKILSSRDIRDRIEKVVTLSSALSGSRAISGLPGVSCWAQAVKDLHPESEVMRSIAGEGEVSDRFVTTKDELFRMPEMDFHNGTEHVLEHGHFDYMVGTEVQVQNAAKRILSLF